MPSGPSCWRRITLGNLKIVFMFMSSPSLKDEEKTSNNAEPTIGNRGTNQPLKSPARHFPELGILTKMPDTAFEACLRGKRAAEVVSNGCRRRHETAIAGNLSGPRLGGIDSLLPALHRATPHSCQQTVC